MATGKTNKILPVGSDSHSTTVVDMDLCPICLDEFRDPRVLPCQHSFCMQCLQNHVDSHKSDIFRKGVFHCPSCRALTYPTYKFKPVSEWGRAFPQNHHLINLLSLTKATEGCIFCEPCLKQKRRRLANFWCKPCCEGLCSNCSNKHASKKDPVSMEHQVLTLSSALSQIPSGPSCPLHSSKEMELFCTKCEQMICCLCFFDMHRKCDSYVHSLLTVYPDKRGAAETSRLNLAAKKKQAEELVKEVLKEKEKVTVSMQEIKREIYSIRLKIEKVLKEKENEIFYDLIQLHDDQQNYLDGLLGQARDMVDSVSRHLATLDCALESSCSQFMNIYQNMSPDYTLQLPQPKRLHHGLRFSPNQKYFNLFREFEIHKFGEVSLTYENKLESATDYTNVSPNIFLEADGVESSYEVIQQIKDNHTKRYEHLENFLRPLEPVKLNQFPATLADETDYRCFGQIVSLPNGRLIVTDSVNHTIKQFNREGHLVGCLKTVSQPFGICVWSNSEVAITFPYSSEIRLVQHVNMVLPWSWRPLKTVYKYRGVAATKDKRLVCSSFDSLSADILTVHSDHTDVVQHIEMAFLYPEVISSVGCLTITMEDDILIVDQDSNCLVCIDLKGRLKFVFRGSSSHCNICMCGVFGISANNKYIYLADTWKSRVIRLFKDGQFDKVLFSLEKFILRPQSVDVTSDGKLLVLERSPMFFVHVFDSVL
ncbi:uncharacterized protein LOC106870863 [Octopus bimaculoides]|nr:uncharacterized protein LOC106870863 [Octopus bimaculoides]|eukprot:XP_014772583.1 PREDICTED: uncharacterized protein LOC106870863 [Octopus bimaculoides]